MFVPGTSNNKFGGLEDWLQAYPEEGIPRASDMARCGTSRLPKSKAWAKLLPENHTGLGAVQNISRVYLWYSARVQRLTEGLTGNKLLAFAIVFEHSTASLR